MDYSFSTFAKKYGKTNISYPLQWVRNISFPENFANVLNE